MIQREVIIIFRLSTKARSAHVIYLQSILTTLQYSVLQFVHGSIRVSRTKLF